MDPHAAQRANAIFIQLRSDDDERLRRGERRRDALRRALESGKTVGGPRAEWIQSTASRLLDTLAQCALEFNETNLDDLISASDMGDASTTLLHWLTQVSDDGT